MVVFIEGQMNTMTSDALETVLDSLSAMNAEAMEGVSYGGVIDAFLTAFRSGLSLLALSVTALEEESLVGVAITQWMDVLELLKAELLQVEGLSMRSIVSRINILQERLVKLHSQAGIPYQEVLALLRDLDTSLIAYSEAVLVLVEEHYFLPQGLLNLEDEYPSPVAFPLLDDAPHLETQPQPSVPLFPLWRNVFEGSFGF
jgi:hypothetical protein